MEQETKDKINTCLKALSTVGKVGCSLIAGAAKFASDGFAKAEEVLDEKKTERQDEPDSV